MRPYPGGDQRVQVSTGGGESPVWSKHNEIFSLADGTVSAVSVASRGGSLTVSKPSVLFRTGGDTHLVAAFDATSDGQHFFMLRARGSRHVSLVFNWPADLARLAAGVP